MVLATAQTSTFSLVLPALSRRMVSARPGADAVVERPGDREVVAEDFELVVEGDGVADADEFLGRFA